jgi:transposase
MCGPAYSSDLTDAEWNAIGPLLSEPAIGCPARPDLRYVINGILFLLRSGTEIRAKPPWSTAEAYYAQWQADGKWPKIVATLLSTRPPRPIPPETITAEDWQTGNRNKRDGD